MCSLNRTPVVGQTLLTVCLSLVLLLFDSVPATSSGEPNRLDPIVAGKTTLASIKIDTISAFISEVVDIPILIRNDVEFCGLQLEVDFPYQYLTLLQAKRGLALSDTSNGQYDWEYFYYRILPFPLADTLYRCLILGLCDLPDGHQGIPLDLHSDYVSLVVLEFMIANGGFPSGTFFPIIFEWEGDVVNDTVVNDWDCVENTFSDPSGIITYSSQDPAQFNPALCFPANSSLEFLDGGVYAYYESGKTGDINLNGLTYEVADWVLFHTFLLEGESVLTDPEQQAANSDVNCDALPWSIADLLYMNRVILHDAVELVCKGQGESGQEHPADQFILVSSSANPGEAVSVPIWFANSLPSRGATFKLVFDENLLSVEGVETLGSRIPGWEDVYPVIHPGELFFITRGDWWNENNLSFSSIEPGAGVLVGVNFRVDQNAPVGEFVPITFETEELLGHYNSYTDTSGLVFVQPATIPGWIFTDVISGDANSDGTVDIADVVYLIGYLYRGGLPPSPNSLGDFNQDGEVNIADLVALINYLYRG
jgi:hypothetical protein